MNTIKQGGGLDATYRVALTKGHSAQDLIRTLANRACRAYCWFVPDSATTSTRPCQTVKRVTELDLTEWRRIIDINLTGTFVCCQAAGRRMEQQNSGVILNIS